MKQLRKLRKTQSPTEVPTGELVSVVGGLDNDFKTSTAGSAAAGTGASHSSTQK